MVILHPKEQRRINLGWRSTAGHIFADTMITDKLRLQIIGLAEYELPFLVFLLRSGTKRLDQLNFGSTLRRHRHSEELEPFPEMLERATQSTVALLRSTR